VPTHGGRTVYSAAGSDPRWGERVRVFKVLIVVAVGIGCVSYGRADEPRSQQEQAVASVASPVRVKFASEVGGPKFQKWFQGVVDEASSWHRDLVVSEAARFDIQGTMDLQLTVKRNGRLSDCRILQSSGNKQMDEAVKKGICWHALQPIPSDGPNSVVLPVMFDLAAAPIPPAPLVRGPSTSPSGSFGTGLPTGQRMGPVSFDPLGADFTGWYRHCETQVYRNWIMPTSTLAMGIKGHVEIEFTVERDGSLSRCVVVLSSGKTPLERQGTRWSRANSCRCLRTMHRGEQPSA